MLSYRHSFHAGNPADVLKHLVLAEVLENEEKQKDTSSTLTGLLEKLQSVQQAS
ncbi:MAG: hypothetical protein AAGK05_05725 [Pseudomonadota bacterium]